MKILIRLVLVLIFLFTAPLYPQQQILSAGKAPFNKANSHAKYGKSPLADIAYANDNSTSDNISIPIPEGNPFTVIGSFYAPEFASSMTKGGDGNFYLTDIAPALYLFDTYSGTCTLIGSITGMEAYSLNGISYNLADNKYYMVSTSALYTLDINTLQATLIGEFTPAISGFMIDLCFDENGTCYSYEVNTTPGAANGYIIDITSAHVTPLGYLGYTPNFGQGMSYDFANQTIYLSAFNSDTFSGQLRTMDKTTGMTTLIYDWGDQIDPFAIGIQDCCPCFDPPINANPPNNATEISADGTTLTWVNIAEATDVEVWFGPEGNMLKVYDDTLINSWETGPLQYWTNYRWRIRDKNDTCGTSGPIWSFRTEHDPNLFVKEKFYPQSAQFWTGHTDGSIKKDGKINTVFPNVAWGVFDIRFIPAGSLVYDVTFSGYVNANNCPSWSATPMGTVYPLISDGATIKGQIQANCGQGIAYIYNDETGTISTGWHTWPLVNSALTDLQAAINVGQQYFAIGFIDRDFSSSYFINFDGWSQPNPPYISVTYPIPVELISFRADVIAGNVVLNWSTATETNNRGFDVERQVSGKQYVVSSLWEKIGFVEGNGTSTSAHSYSYTDKNVSEDKYSYRLKQIDFDGTFKYSNVVEVKLNHPLEFSLEQNYPNPFNPTTVIEYQIPEDSRVVLKVFDILGSEVNVLVNANQPAGRYSINFNGSGLSNGIYYYRLTSSSFIQTKKMILLK